MVCLCLQSFLLAGQSCSNSAGATQHPLSVGKPKLTPVILPYWLNTLLPEQLLQAFHVVSSMPALKNHWYGPLDKLLDLLFGESHYIIWPQASPSKGSLQQVNFLVSGHRSIHGIAPNVFSPVMILEIKDIKLLDISLHHQHADNQIHDRFYTVTPGCQLARLYGLSFFRSRFCIYHLDLTGSVLVQVQLPATLCKVSCGLHGGLQDDWAFNLVTEKGYRVFLKM